MEGRKASETWYLGERLNLLSKAPLLKSRGGFCNANAVSKADVERHRATPLGERAGEVNNCARSCTLGLVVFSGGSRAGGVGERTREIKVREGR